MRTQKTIGCLLLSLVIASCSSKGVGVGGGAVSDDKDKHVSTAVVGEKITPWEKGQLDIHFINTTAGDCIFIIFPDGTQMLVDAAGALTPTGGSSVANKEIRSRWDPLAEKINYGEFIASYVKTCMEWTSNRGLDYALLTHFHNDHFGGRVDATPVSVNSPTYQQQSFAYIMDTFQIGKLIDRGYPDYDYPFDMATKAVGNAANCANYITAVKWHVKNKGLNAEKFIPGVTDQIALKYEASKYPDCYVRNLVANGEVWTGTGTQTKKMFPEKAKIAGDGSLAGDNCPCENALSIGFKLSYGKFDVFLGGDLCYNGAGTLAWKDIETPTAQVCGRVEVMKADHHAVAKTHGCGMDSPTTAQAMKYLYPQVWVVSTWADTQPRPDKLAEVSDYLPNMDIFITNLAPSTLNAANAGIKSKIRGYDGHTLVRVDEGGEYFNVYMLTDSDRKMTVKTIAGPYKCR